jgi:hypothetical protein
MKNVDKVLETVDFNIRMFSKYTSEFDRQRLAKMIQEREEIEKMQQGKMEYTDMSYGAREWFSQMPEWGTYGT